MPYVTFLQNTSLEVVDIYIPVMGNFLMPSTVIWNFREQKGILKNRSFISSCFELILSIYSVNFIMVVVCLYITSANWHLLFNKRGNIYQTYNVLRANYGIFATTYQLSFFINYLFGSIESIFMNKENKFIHYVCTCILYENLRKHCTSHLTVMCIY